MREEDILRWKQMSFMEQMANIGSEVYRAGNWKSKNNYAYAEKAFERALELIDITAECSLRSSALRELMRAREFFCMLFFEDTENSFDGINKYFRYFALGLKRGKLNPDIS